MIDRADLADEIIDALTGTFDATFENGLDRRDLAVDP